MNEIFSFKRFGLLLKEQIYKNLKLFLMGTIVVFAILCALNLIAILSSSNQILDFDTRAGFYVALLFPTGILLSGFWFSSLQKPSIEIGGLLLPASHFEKICIAFVINVLLFIIMYILIVQAVEFVLFQDTKFLKIIMKHGLRYGSNINELYLWFLALQSIFLFGSLLFKKLAPIKTAFVLFLIYLLLLIIHIVVLKHVFKNGNFNNIGKLFFSTYSIKIPLFYEKIMEIVIYSSFPIFWIASYFKLKEKQV